MISNLSRRIPGLEFVGVTLNLPGTRRRFGIESFPLAGVSRTNHAQKNTDEPETDGNQFVGEGQNVKARFKQSLKRIPIVGNILKFANTAWREIVHILAASRVVRGLDFVLVPGGGALDEFWGGPWGHPWNLVKWSVLSRIHGVPFLFLSVGKCSIERPASRLFIKVALKLASYRSYRDLDSKNAVQNLIHAPDDPVVPDLAFNYPLPFVRNPRTSASSDGRLVVGFSPIAYCNPRVWPLKDGQRYARYLQQLAEIVKWLLKEGHQLIFFATDGPDLETIKDLFAAIADFRYDSGAILILPGPVEQSVDGHLREIGRADLIVASRLHGVILSHLIALPVLAISFDPKVDAHMASVNQMNYCMDINTFTRGDFVERFEALKGARQREASHLSSVTHSFRRDVEVQYDRIFGSGLRSQNGQFSHSSAPESGCATMPAKTVGATINPLANR